MTLLSLFYTKSSRVIYLSLPNTVKKTNAEVFSSPQNAKNLTAALQKLHLLEKLVLR